MPRSLPARRTATTSFVLGAALLLTACGGSGEASDTSTDGPLADFWEDVYGEWDEDKANAEAMEIEEATARCMTEQGFEYQPVDQSQSTFSFDTADQDPAEYAAEYGYGFSLSPEPTAEEEAAMEEWVDPNQEYVEAMSESEQTAYYEALYGDMASMEYDEDAEMPEYDPAQAGCQGAAQEEVYGAQNALWESEEMVAFNDATTQLYEDVEKDPRLADVTTAWAGCMAEAGFSGYATPQEAMDDMMERSNAMWETDSPEGPSEEQMTEIQDLERDTAVADHACQQEVSYAETYQDVQRELEEAFVEEHADTLETIRDLVAEAQE